MAFFNWSDNYSVGVKELDDQHKILINLLNTLYDAMKAGKTGEAIGPLLSELMKYAQVHFANEEEILERNGYSELPAHRQEHEKFAAQVLEFEKQLALGRHNLSLDLGTFLKEWLSSHIKSTDQRYTAFLKERGVS